MNGRRRKRADSELLVNMIGPSGADRGRGPRSGVRGKDVFCAGLDWPRQQSAARQARGIRSFAGHELCPRACRGVVHGDAIRRRHEGHTPCDWCLAT